MSKLYDKKLAYDDVLDRWVPHFALNAYETIVAMVLVRVLEGYGHPDFALSLDSLINGIKSKTHDGWFIAPLKSTMSLMSLRRAIESLENKGVINVVRAGRQSSRYSINKEVTMALPIPKRLKDAKPAEDDGYCSQGTNELFSQNKPIVPTERPNRRGVEETLEETKATLAPGARGLNSFDESETTAGKFSAVLNRQKNLKPVAPGTHTGKPMSTFDWERTFNSEMSDCFPGSGLRGRWGPKTRKLVKDLAKAVGTDAEMNAFVEFAVRRWSQVRAAKFGWAKHPLPLVPDINVLTLNWVRDGFLNAFKEKLALPNEVNDDITTEQEIARAMAVSGKTREQVIFERGQAAGVSKARAEAQKDKSLVAATALANDLRAEQAANELARRRREAAAAAPAPAPIVVQADDYDWVNHKYPEKKHEEPEDDEDYDD